MVEKLRRGDGGDGGVACSKDSGGEWGRKKTLARLTLTLVALDALTFTLLKSILYFPYLWLECVTFSGLVIWGFFLVGYFKGLVWYKWVLRNFFLPLPSFFKTQSSVHRIIVITCVLLRWIHSLRIHTSLQYISYRASAHACMNHVCVLTCIYRLLRFLFAIAFQHFKTCQSSTDAKQIYICLLCHPYVGRIHNLWMSEVQRSNSKKYFCRVKCYFRCKLVKITMLKRTTHEKINKQGHKCREGKEIQNN